MGFIFRNSTVPPLVTDALWVVRVTWFVGRIATDGTTILGVTFGARRVDGVRAMTGMRCRNWK